MQSFWVRWRPWVMVLGVLFGLNTAVLAQKTTESQPAAVPESQALAEGPVEIDLGALSAFERAWEGGFVVFSVLLILVVFSILSWALILVKFLYLAKMQRLSREFIKSFWDSRSLNDLNSRLADYPYSPIKEVFRTGYAELVRGSQLKDQTSSASVGAKAAMDNLNRTLLKARLTERQRLERFLSILATIASSAPFIGLLGTVWGIMNAFEGIAQSGSAHLAAVAPGISEALIATAFGLGAAIPAVMGYNLANAKIRKLLSQIDGFMADFANIVERYFVADKSKNHSAGTHTL